jgi:hypothetical protein
MAMVTRLKGSIGPIRQPTATRHREKVFSSFLDMDNINRICRDHGGMFDWRYSPFARSVTAAVLTDYVNRSLVFTSPQLIHLQLVLRSDRKVVPSLNEREKEDRIVCCDLLQLRLIGFNDCVSQHKSIAKKQEQKKQEQKMKQNKVSWKTTDFLLLG